MPTAAETIKIQLLGRVRPEAPYLAYFQGAIEDAFSVLQKFESERQRVSADGRFSEQGKREAVAALVAERFAPDLAGGPARKARRAREHVESRFAAVGKPKFDKTDVVAAMDRREIRDFLQSQPEARRFSVAVGVMTDRSVGEAILSGPAFLTGLSPDQFGQLQSIHLQKFHADELAEVEAERNDIAAVAAAVEIARKKLAEASAMPAPAFDKLWAKLEQKAEAA